MRTIFNQSTHDRLVNALAAQYKSEGYYVTADHVNHPNGSPPMFGGCIPDIYAINGPHKVIAEAETSDSIADDHTKEQLKAFANVPGASLHIIVPKESLTAAQNQVSKWGITVQKWWYL